jgi:alpha-beta hydrolase superfamily lysophospholipase
VTDTFDPEIEQFSQRMPAVKLSGWRLAPEAWRLARRFDRKYTNYLFRARSARIIPASLKARFTAMGIPADIVEETLGTIHSLEQWGDAWIETAQRFLGDYRRQVSGDTALSADEARRLAAMCYHIAQILIFDDDRTISLCRASTASLFAQAQLRLYPYAHRVRLPWRTRELPAYYMVPEDRGHPTGLVVILNGASTAKEETFGWTRAFIQQGMAVVVIDSPGTGEATKVAPYSPDDVDVLDGVFDLVSEQPNLDPRRVAVIGVSMGGNQAMRALAYDRRILAGVAVTPVYDPSRWLGHASPLLRAQVTSLTGDHERTVDSQTSSFGLADSVSRIRRPVLVFGAGRDVVVPPSDSQLLASKLGALGTLVWYPEAGHCLYDLIPQWTRESAEWIDAIGRARVGEGGVPPIDDARQLAELGRDVLDRPAMEPVSESFDEDLEEFARLVPPEQVEHRPRRSAQPEVTDEDEFDPRESALHNG